MAGKKADRLHAFSRDRSILILLILSSVGIHLGRIRRSSALKIVTTAGLSLNHPVYHASSKELRNQMMEEMLYLSRHSEESPFHLIGHLYLF